MNDLGMADKSTAQSRMSPNNAARFHEETIETDTGSLLDPRNSDVVIAMTMPYSRSPEAAPYYLAVPKELAEVQERHQLPMWAWRVELHSLAPDTLPMGLDILGPVILGRSSPRDAAVDVDFTPYDAMNRGVSRRHALIRPSEERLYLIDLSSTNGTLRNEVPLGAGIAVTLEDRDTISLGKLTFEVRILSRPDPASAEVKMNDTQPMNRDDVESEVGGV